MKKFIDYIVIGVVSVSCIGIGAAIIKDSYDKYQVYYQENFPEIDPTDKAKLLSIRAEFAPGIHYYDNNKAKPIKEHFIVTGTWIPNKEGEPTFEYVLKPEKRPYTVTTSDTFSRTGGEITISYQGFSTTLNAELIPVKLERLDIVQAPYLVKYAVGDFFDKTGTIANAVFNDGEIKQLTDKELFVPDAVPLKTTDKIAYVAYEEEGIKKSAQINISVHKTLENGEIVSIDPLVSGGTIINGDSIKNANLTVVANYANGNKKLLTTYDYVITNGEKTANIGIDLHANVTYKTNEKIKGKVPLLIQQKIEGEKGYVVGGTYKNEPEYIISKDGTATKLPNIIFCGDFGKTVLNGKDAYVIYSLNAYADTTVDFTMKVSNSNLVQIDNQFWMRPLQINTIADLYVNEVKVDIPDSVILSGCGPHKEYEPLYNVYSTITFKDLKLKPGYNDVKIKFKKSTQNEVNYFEESPSTMNIDYVTFETKGATIPEDVHITNLHFASTFGVRFGDNFDTMFVPIYGEYGVNNQRIILTDKFATITKPTGYATIGSHTFTCELLNGKGSISKTYVIGDVVMQAENAKISGNDHVVPTTEHEYVLDEISGKYNKGAIITAIKGMDHSATNYSNALHDTSLEFTTKGAPGGNRLIVKCSNTNFFRADNGLGYTKAVNLQDVIDIYVNGNKHTFSVAMPTISDAGHDDWCWMGMFELDCGVIELNAGVDNKIKIVAKTGGSVPKNIWNEYAIPRFDYIKLTVQ